ncbi:hypothetical protein D3C81_1730890 [compost metagenome]
MKTKLLILGISVLVISTCIPVTRALIKEFEPASVAEIQSAISNSDCAEKMLRDANRDAIEIRRRDLKFVHERCISVAQQTNAF